MYDLRNSSVFNLIGKVYRDCDVVTDGGRQFQVRAAATEKERSPMELRNVSAAVEADRSRLRGSKSDTR